MNKKYHIIDNALNINDFDNLKNVVLSNNFNWFYQQNVAYKKQFKEYAEETFYFTHTFYEYDQPQSEHFNLLKPIFDKINLNCLARVKANLYPNVNKFINHPFHTDGDFKHKGAIIYLNTNNGKTVLKDGTEINSIENRILLFNSFEEHCSTTCTDEKIRVNINLNYF